MKNLSVHLYVIVLFLFIGIVSIPLFSDGMFMDGILYAAISNNMSQGLGSFWSPYLSEYRFSEFYEHPPLALGLQSLWFSLFGDSFLVERFYSLFTYLFSGFFVVAVWKQLGQSIKTGWLPLLFWFSISTVSWACANNMLENTMTVFVLISSWLYFKGVNQSKLYFYVLSGCVLSLAVLSKGFVCLFIWALPFAWWAIAKKTNLSDFVKSTFLLVSFTILPIAMLFFFSEEAAHNMTQYIQNQVIRSIDKVNTAGTRFFILGNFFESILPSLGIALLILALGIKKLSIKKTFSQNNKVIFAFTFLVFSGIIPIMISLKQSGFYILSVYPFVGIVLGLITISYIKNWLKKMNQTPVAFKIIRPLSFLLFITSLYLSNDSASKIGRDKDKLSDVYQVIETIHPEKTLNICPVDYQDFSQHGYFARYGQVSLLRQKNEACNFFLVKKENCTSDLTEYINTEISLKENFLYKKKTN